MAEPFDVTLPAVGAKPWNLNPAVVEMRTRIASIDDAINGRLSETNVTNAINSAADKVAIVATPDRYPGIYPDGAGDSTAGLQAALADAISKKATLVIPGRTYRTSSPWTNVIGGVPQSISVDATGATFLQTANQPVVDFYASTGTVFPVTAMSEADESTSSVGGDGTATRVITFTVTGTPGYTLGDRIRLMADDVIPLSRAGDGTLERRMGADFIVLSSSGSTVKVVGSFATIDGTFTVNPRIVKFGNEAISWVGGTFDTARYVENTIGFIRLTGLNHATVSNIRILRSASQCIQLRGCYASSVENVLATFATNNPSTGSVGYVVLDTSSTLCVYTNLHGTMVRHVYTDDNNAIEAGSANYWHHGSTRGSQVSNISAYGTLSEAVSPHAQSRDISVSNVLAIDCRGAVAHRGIGHRYEGIHSIGCRRGFTAFTETGIATTATHSFTLDGAKFRSSIENDIRLNKNYDGPNVNTRVTTQDKILNVVIEDAGNESIYIRNSSVLLQNISIYSKSSLPDSGRYIEKDNSTVRLSGTLTFNLGTLIGGTGLDLIHHSNSAGTAGDAGTWRGGLIQVFGSTAQVGRIGYLDRGVSSHQIEVSAYFENPITARSRISGSRGSGSLLTFQMGKSSSALTPVTDAFITDAASGEWLRMMNESLETYAVEATTAGRELHALLSPNRDGQILHVINTGTQPFTVKHGSTLYGTNLTSGTDKTIAVGGRIQLQWMSSNGGSPVWRQYA